MNITIRQEIEDDYDDVDQIIQKAFASVEYSDHREQLLVERLRKSDNFIRELSIIAEVDGTKVGHILLTRLRIINETNEFVTLGLAPVSVHPQYQGKGIGGQLIRYAHDVARGMGYKSIVLLGHASYYPKFGYQVADKFGIELPFDVPKENCMIMELVEDGLKGVSGMVQYPSEFNE